MAALRKIGNKFIQNIKYGRQEPSTELETDSGYGSVAKDDKIKEDAALSLPEAARSSGKHSPRLKKAKSMGFMGIGSYMRTATWFSNPADDLSPSSPVSPRCPHYETPKKHWSMRNRVPSSFSWSEKKSKGSTKPRRATIPDYEQDQFHSPLSHREESPIDATVIAKHVETLQVPLDTGEPKKGLDVEKNEDLLSGPKIEIPRITRGKHTENSQTQLDTIVKAEEAPDAEKTEDLPSTSMKEIRPQLLWPQHPNQEGDNDDPYVESKKKDPSEKLDPLAISLKTTIQKASAIAGHNSPSMTRRKTVRSPNGGSVPDGSVYDDNSVHDNISPHDSDLQEHVQEKKIADRAFKDQSSDFIDDRRSLPSYISAIEAEEMYVKAKATFEAEKLSMLLSLGYKIDEQPVKDSKPAENQTSPTATRTVKFSNSDASMRSSLMTENGSQDDEDDTEHRLEADASPSFEPSMGSRICWESSRAERAKRYTDAIIHDTGSGLPSLLSLDGTTNGSKVSPLRYAIEAIERPSILELDKEFQKGVPLSNVTILKDHGKQLLEKALEQAERNNRVMFETHDKHGNPSMIPKSKSETVIALETVNEIDSSQSPTRLSTPKTKSVQAVKSSSPNSLPTPPATPPEDKMKRNDKVTTEIAAQLARHRAQKLAKEEAMRVSSSSELEEEPALVSSDDNKDASSCSSAPSDLAQREEEAHAMDIDGDEMDMDSDAGEKSLDTNVGNSLVDSDVGKKFVDPHADEKLVESDTGDVDSGENSVDEEKKQSRLKRLSIRDKSRSWRRTVAHIHRELYD